MHQKLILYTQTHTHGILDNVSYPILRVFQKIRLFLPAEGAAVSTAKDTQTDKDTHTDMTHRYIYTYTDTFTQTQRQQDTDTQTDKDTQWLVGTHWTHFHYFHFPLKSVTFLL